MGDTTIGLPEENMFVEEQPGPAWLRALGALSAVILVVAAAVLVAGIARLWGQADALLLIGALALHVGLVGFTAATGLLNRISVSVADGRISGRLSPFRVFTIPVGEIIETGMEKVTVVRAGGIGYRMKPSCRFLLFDDGPAVAVRTRRGRTYIIRSDRRDELVAAIENARTTESAAGAQPTG